MKKLWSLIAIAMLFVGCEVENDDPITPPNPPQSDSGYVPNGNNGQPINNGFVQGGERNVLPYPIDANHNVANDKGETVWQYFYDYDATNGDDFKCLANISMYCNADEDFDFLNNTILFCGNYGLMEEASNVAGDFRREDIELIPSYTTPYFSSSYYCVFSKGSHPEYYHNRGYRYEMHFPLLFPAPGKYILWLDLAQPVALDKPDVVYAYTTEWITVVIEEDKHDDELPMCGGRLKVAKGYNVDI